MIFPPPLQHPQFGGSSPGFPNDLALLELQTPFLVGGAIQIATLPSSRTEDFANLPDCWMTGWGRTSSNVTKTGTKIPSLKFISTKNKLLTLASLPYRG